MTLRADEIDLAMEIGDAGLHFLGRRLAVAGGLAGSVGPALEDVGDIDRIAGQPHGLDDPREQLAGLADEGFALFIFVGARGFADEHEFGVDIADAEDHVFARGGQVRAFDAGHDLRTQFGESGGLGLGAKRRSGGGCAGRSGQGERGRGRG